MSSWHMKSILFDLWSFLFVIDSQIKHILQCKTLKACLNIWHIIIFD